MLQYSRGDFMATKAQLDGNRRHQEKLDRVIFYLKKGGRDKIKARAAEIGAPSVNAYIVSLIEADMGKLTEEDE